MAILRPAPTPQHLVLPFSLHREPPSAGCWSPALLPDSSSKSSLHPSFSQPLPPYILSLENLSSHLFLYLNDSQASPGPPLKHKGPICQGDVTASNSAPLKCSPFPPLKFPRGQHCLGNLRGGFSYSFSTARLCQFSPLHLSLSHFTAIAHFRSSPLLLSPFLGGLWKLSHWSSRLWFLPCLSS